MFMPMRKKSGMLCCWDLAPRGVFFYNFPLWHLTRAFVFCSYFVAVVSFVHHFSHQIVKRFLSFPILSQQKCTIRTKLTKLYLQTMIGLKTPKTEKRLVVFFDRLNHLRKTENLPDSHSRHTRWNHPVVHSDSSTVLWVMVKNRKPQSQITPNKLSFFHTFKAK